MTESPHVLAVRAWMKASETYDAEGFEGLVTDSFTLEAVDEHKNSHKFSRSEFFKHLREQIQTHNTHREIVINNLQEISSDEVTVEVQSKLYPSGQVTTGSSHFKFVGDKVNYVIGYTTAAHHEQMRLHQRAL